MSSQTLYDSGKNLAEATNALHKKIEAAKGEITGNVEYCVTLKEKKKILGESDCFNTNYEAAFAVALANAKIDPRYFADHPKKFTLEVEARATVKMPCNAKPTPAGKENKAAPSLTDLF